jgi:SAM-dependent methyltransferase
MGKFPESALAHELLDGLDGVEIGGGAHNPFSIPGCKNVNWTDQHNLCTDEEIRLCGEFLPVDIVADAGSLPFNDASLGYIISCHQIEHMWDTIGTLKEYWRVIRPGGYLFMVVPHKDRCEPDSTMETTTIEELEKRYNGEIPVPEDYGPHGFYGHRSYWRTADFIALVEHLGMKVYRYLEICDKVPNGFTVVIRKPY